MPNLLLHDAPLMLCAGEALTDMIDQGDEHWVSRVGGSVWNVARALAVLGEPTAFAGAMLRYEQIASASGRLLLPLRIFIREDALRLSAGGLYQQLGRQANISAHNLRQRHPF